MGDESNCWGKAFANGVGFLVGEGGRLRFCFDDWVGVGPLIILYPRVFWLVDNKEASVSDCYE